MSTLYCGHCLIALKLLATAAAALANLVATICSDEVHCTRATIEKVYMRYIAKSPELHSVSYCCLSAYADKRLTKTSL
jgi:hypothetical protein